MIELFNIKYITDKEASSRYGYSVSWFQKQRQLKKPPPFVKIQGKGKVYYAIDELDKWFKENIFVYR